MLFLQPSLWFSFKCTISVALLAFKFYGFSCLDIMHISHCFQQLSFMMYECRCRSLCISGLYWAAWIFRLKCNHYFETFLSPFPDSFLIGVSSVFCNFFLSCRYLKFCSFLSFWSCNSHYLSVTGSFICLFRSTVELFSCAVNLVSQGTYFVQCQECETGSVMQPMPKSG